MLFPLWDQIHFPCLEVVDLAAKVNPAHVLNYDVHNVSLLSSDIHHQGSVSLQQALENLFDGQC